VGLSVDESEDGWEYPQLAATTTPMYPWHLPSICPGGDLVTLPARIGWVDDAANSCEAVVVHGAGNDVAVAGAVHSGSCWDPNVG
jgi:hypothetical protein